MAERVADYPAHDRREGLVGGRVGGRFMTTYDPELALQIVERMANGETLKEICKAGSGMPHRVTFLRWAVNNPDLSKALAAAKELSASALEEEALELGRAIHQRPESGAKVRATEVLMQQLRWSAERRDPAKFGQRSQVSVRVPIQINTTLDMGKDAVGGPDNEGIYTVNALNVVGVGGQLTAEQQKKEYKPLVVPARPRNPKHIVQKKTYTPFHEVTESKANGTGQEPIRAEGDQSDGEAG